MIPYISQLLYTNRLIYSLIQILNTRGMPPIETMFKLDRQFDGMLGFGPGKSSVLSQLASQGMTPRVVSHCLRGAPDANVVGFLVFGEALHLDVAYNPMVPNQ
jgi:hypothetical protein